MESILMIFVITAFVILLLFFPRKGTYIEKMNFSFDPTGRVEIKMNAKEKSAPPCKSEHSNQKDN